MPSSIEWSKLQVSHLIYSFIVVIGSIITVIGFFIPIIGERNVLIISSFLVGILVAEIIHWFYSTFQIYRSPDQVAILHNTFPSSISQGLVKEALKDQKVTIHLIDFKDYDLATQSNTTWLKVRDKQIKIFNGLIKRTRSSTQVHYFGHASIPLTIHLGWLFSLRYRVQTYQHLRKGKRVSWGWSSRRRPRNWDIAIEEPNVQETTEIVFVIEQSAKIPDSDVSIIVNEIPKVKISVPTPSIQDLKAEIQAIEISNCFRSLLDQYKEVKKVHLFCAIPSPTAFMIGQSINFTMHPEIVLYQFNQYKTPHYQNVIIINERT